MVWADKLAKANGSADEMLRKAEQGRQPRYGGGSMDDFLRQLDIGDPDPANHLTNDSTLGEITDVFLRDKPADWRQRD